ncbi:MAG: hypothetical protein FWE87_00145 [Coriobacteriia bacterium]|nr:hypothetical protein [Coriobacteriia bacterium]
MPQKFAVIGTPITHSLSPIIHDAIFAHEGRDATMGRIDPLTAEQLAQDLASWLAEGTFEGLAITAPYKPLVANLEGERSEEVDALESANTLTRRTGIKKGTPALWQVDNTDVAGFTSAIQKLLSPIKYRTFVVFGTGATARTIVYALQAQEAAMIQVVGRSLGKAQGCIHTVEESVSGGAQVTRLSASTVPPGKRFDCAINATTLGISAHDELVFPLSWFKEYAASVFDVVYRPHGTTRLIKEATSRGIDALDGRAMLYAQALEQARIWGATTPDDELMEVITKAGEEGMTL